MRVGCRGLTQLGPKATSLGFAGGHRSEAGKKATARWRSLAKIAFYNNRHPKQPSMPKFKLPEPPED